MSGGELAKLLDIHPSAVSRYFNHGKLPKGKAGEEIQKWERSPDGKKYRRKLA